MPSKTARLLPVRHYLAGMAAFRVGSRRGMRCFHVRCGCGPRGLSVGLGRGLRTRLLLRLWCRPGCFDARLWCGLGACLLL